MSRGLGRIERAIAAEIETAKSGRYNHGDPCPVHASSWSIASACFRSNGWNRTPSRVQRRAATRAMRSFVRKHPQFALTGGKGRKPLMLYEPGDPLSAMRAKLAAAAPVERIDLLIEERHEVRRRSHASTGSFGSAASSV
jgi:hypothetical protein